MNIRLLLALLLVFGGIGALQAKWVSRTPEKNRLQDRCLIPLILTALLLVLSLLGWQRDTGWTRFGWEILLLFGVLPLVGCVWVGTLVGLWLYQKRKK